MMTVFSRLGAYSHSFLRHPRCLLRPPTVGRQFRTQQGPVRTKGFGLSNEKGSGIRGRTGQPKQEPVKKVEQSAETNGSNGAGSQTEAWHMLQKTFVYTVVATPVMFAGCMVWQYERIRSKTMAVFKPQMQPQDPTSLREHFRQIWNHGLSPGRQLALSLVAVNTYIFALWKIPRLRSLMLKYFTCTPKKGQSVFSTTLSGFSHQSFLHLFVNMYVLESFCKPCSHIMGGKEQTFAVFLGAATFSGLIGNLYKTLSRTAIPSVGASGGILGLIAFACISYPDARLSIAFVDKLIPHSFSGTTALYTIMAVDTLGLIMRWRVLDHAGHLGGAIFGWWYALYGQQLWQKYQKPLVKKWHELRTGSPVKTED